ncbi:hypothetical protein, partial [Aliivibrio fischeri]|uniref:hypothetical protein n=1 Tax=Aliivibrio fischeri TaxID=668 RepID=UPI001BDEFE33
TGFFTFVIKLKEARFMLSELWGQLVERNLTKVEVTPNALKIGNLVCRSAHTKNWKARSEMNGLFYVCDIAKRGSIHAL